MNCSASTTSASARLRTRPSARPWRCKIPNERARFKIGIQQHSIVPRAHQPPDKSQDHAGKAPRLRYRTKILAASSNRKVLGIEGEVARMFPVITFYAASQGLIGDGHQHPHRRLTLETLLKQPLTA